MSSWRPFADVSSKQRYLSSPSVLPLVGGVEPGQAYEERIAVEPGDVVIAGSRGLFDMVWLHGAPSANLRREVYALSTMEGCDPGGLAAQLAALASSVGGAGVGGSPLAQQLAEEGRGLIPMQDVGDNAVIVARVER